MTALDQFPAVLCGGHDLVPQAGQDPREVVAHVAFVVGNGYSQWEDMDHCLGRVMTISVPPAGGGAGGNPAAMGFDQPPADGHAQAGAAGLGRVERFEDPPLLLGVQARTVVADHDLQGRAAIERGRPAADVDLDRIGAGGQCVLEDVAKDAFQGETVQGEGGGPGEAAELDRTGGAGSFQFQLPPGLVDDLIEAEGLAVQHDRRGILADLFVEMVQAVLGDLHAVQEVEGLGAILDFQGQHLQAGLHPLHGVAVFVGQPCGHFADGRQAFGLPLRRHVAVACHVPDLATVAQPRGRRNARRSARP